MCLFGWRLDRGLAEGRDETRRRAHVVDPILGVLELGIEPENGRARRVAVPRAANQPNSGDAEGGGVDGMRSTSRIGRDVDDAAAAAPQ